jgi:hypothetical protein
MKALSIQDPWASLIVAGIKPVENRTWSTPVRGPVLIHAGKKFDTEAYFWLLNNWHQCGMPWTVDELLRQKERDRSWARGAIIGTADLVDCVTSHPSPFFFGEFGFVFANAKPIEPVPMRGRLQFFNVEWPA